MRAQFPSLLSYRLKETLPGNQIKYFPTDSLIGPDKNFVVLDKSQSGTGIAVQVFDVFGNKSQWSNQQMIRESETDLNFGPRHIQCQNTSSGVLIQWFMNDTVVMKYILTRIDNSGATETFDIPSTDQQSFTDTTAKSGMRYGYFLMSEDTEGVKSSLTELVVIKRN